MRRTAFWLSVDGGEPTGPFSIAQLQGLWSIGQISFSAQVMQEGDREERWRPVADVVLPWQVLEPHEPEPEKKRRVLSPAVLFGIAVLMLGGVAALWDEVEALLPKTHRQEIATVRRWIQNHALEPESVTFHGVGAARSGDVCVVTADFSQTNEHGSLGRNRWTFTLDGRSGSVESVMSGADRIVYQSPEVQARLHASRQAAEEARHRASTAEAAAQARAAKILAGSGPTPQRLPALPTELPQAEILLRKFPVDDSVQRALEEARLAPAVPPGQEGLPVVRK